MRDVYNPEGSPDCQDKGSVGDLPERGIDLASSTSGDRHQRRRILHPTVGHWMRDTSNAVAGFETSMKILRTFGSPYNFFFLLGPALTEKCQKLISRCVRGLGIHGREHEIGQARFRQLRRKGGMRPDMGGTINRGQKPAGTIWPCTT